MHAMNKQASLSVLLCMLGIFCGSSALLSYLQTPVWTTSFDFVSELTQLCSRSLEVT